MSCVRSCLRSWPASTNPLLQTVHRKLFSPLCARMWAFSSVAFGVQYWQPSNEHLCTFPDSNGGLEHLQNKSLIRLFSINEGVVGIKILNKRGNFNLIISILKTRWTVPLNQTWLSHPKQLRPAFVNPPVRREVGIVLGAEGTLLALELLLVRMYSLRYEMLELWAWVYGS